MNRWSTLFDNDPFHTSWKTLKASLDGINLGAEASSDIVDEYNRIKKISILINSTIENIDKDVFHLQTFTSAIPFVEKAQSSLSEFKNISDVESIQLA